MTRFWEVRETRPRAWRRKSFRRWVDLIRGQLALIATTATLAESFAREAALLGTLDEPDEALRGRLERSPLVVAYIVRWLELRDRVELPSWRELTATGDRVARRSTDA